MRATLHLCCCSDTRARLTAVILLTRTNKIVWDCDLELLKHLFEDLENQEGVMQLLDLTEQGSGVRIFIGSENKLFSLSGSSVVVAPYRDKDSRVIGALGVIGPTRLNYARIVPMVDYTAKVVSRILEGGR